MKNLNAKLETKKNMMTSLAFQLFLPKLQLEGGGNQFSLDNSINFRFSQAEASFVKKLHLIFKFLLKFVHGRHELGFGIRKLTAVLALESFTKFSFQYPLRLFKKMKQELSQVQYFNY